MADNIIILGAGPAGLFCAEELKRNEKQPKIIEKSATVGGLSKTLSYKDFKFNLGPHIFFTKDEYLKSMLKDTLKENLISHEWKVSQIINKKTYNYPNTLKNLRKNLGAMKMFHFFISFLTNSLKRKKNNFQSYIYSKLGKAFADFNVINYTEKMWGIKPDQLSIKSIKERASRFSTWNALKHAMKQPKKYFYYPKEGLDQLYTALAKGKDIEFRSHPEKITHNNINIQSIKATGMDLLQVNHLISSIPLPDFLASLDPKPPKSVMDASANLKYRSQVHLILLIDKPKITTSHWIYFPEKSTPFARIYEPKMFSESMARPNQTSLVVEFFCFKDDKIWKTKDEDLFEMTMQYLTENNILDSKDVFNYKVIHLEDAYPVLDMESVSNLKQINDYLSKFENLSLIGRHGQFTYDNQNQAAESGINAARAVVGKKPGLSKDSYIDL